MLWNLELVSLSEDIFIKILLLFMEVSIQDKYMISFKTANEREDRTNIMLYNKK